MGFKWWFGDDNAICLNCWKSKLMKGLAVLDDSPFVGLLVPFILQNISFYKKDRKKIHKIALPVSAFVISYLHATSYLR